MVDGVRQMGHIGRACERRPRCGSRAGDTLEAPKAGHSGNAKRPSLRVSCHYHLPGCSDFWGFSVSAGRPRHDSLRRPTPSPLTKAVAATARMTPARAGRKTGSLDTRGTPAVVSGRHTAPDSTVAVDDSRQEAGGWFGPMGCPSGV